MDSEIEELKEELRIQRKLLEDTNAMVHKMHRAAVWSRVWSFVWWGAVLLLTGSVYYYFLLPYLQQLMELYSNVQGGMGESKNLFEQAQQLLQQYSQ